MHPVVVCAVLLLGQVDTDVNADQLLMEQLRTEVEALPESDRLLVGVEILRSHLGEIRTPAMRQKMNFSIGSIYAEVGKPEDGKPFLLQAAFDTSDERVSGEARRKMADLLAAEGKVDEAMRLLQIRGSGSEGGEQPPGGKSNMSPKNSGIDQAFFDRLTEARLLQQKGDNAGSYAVLAKLLEEYPSGADMILAQAKMPFTRQFGAGNNEAAFKELGQLSEAIPSLANDPSLLSDQVAAAQSSKQVKLARKLAEQFVKSFPDHKLTPGHLFFLATNALESGETDRAKDYFTAVTKHPESPEEYRRIATSNLAEVDRPNSLELPASSGDGETVVTGKRSILLVVFLNLVVILVFGGLRILRNQRAKAEPGKG